jgi:membrane associated rhomboid family serine protease/Zn-finger nucleic acid-binding protein
MDALAWSGVEVDMCGHCRGVWFDAEELSRIHGLASDGSLLGELRSNSAGGSTEGVCPRKDGYLRPVRLARLPLLRCDGCAGLFVGGAELRDVRRALKGTGGSGERAREIRERFDEERLRAADDELRAFALGEAPPEPESARPARSGGGAYLFQVLTGLPIEEHNRRQKTPLITWALIAANVVAFFLLSSSDVLGSWALYPAALAEGTGFAGLLTYMFVHGGFLHLAGNMYFLYLFGDNVEDRMGQNGYLAFYLVCGLAAAIGHVLSDLGSTVPVVGASGAISGVMGAYAAMFPRRRLIMILFFVQWPLRVWFWVTGWVALQAFAGAAGMPGVAWWAHLGGFFFGFLVVIAARIGGARWAAAEK